LFILPPLFGRKEEAMLRRYEIPILDEDPMLFDAPAEPLVRRLRSARRDIDDGGLGIRWLLERPEDLSEAWRAHTET
jgi:hypothetical protein